MNKEMLAIIKKDIRGIAANRRMMVSLLVVPIVLTVFLPTVFILTMYLAPTEMQELQELLAFFPADRQSQNISDALAGLLLNYFLPVFFLIIPVMASSVMAASSFVGEKEKHTLETLLYAPLSLRQIFRAKVFAAFLLSMSVSFLSFLVMLIVLETEVSLTSGSFILPGIQWLFIMLLVSPAISLIAVTLIVRASAKAQSMEDAQQGAVFLVLPIMMLLVGQFTGVMLISPLILLGIGAVCALLAALLLRRCMGRFTYEMLL